MRDSRLTRGFLAIVTPEDQDAWNWSFGDGADNRQSDIEWIYGSPELDLLTNMEIETADRALRHQAGGLDLLELVDAGETPIGPHVNLLRFRSDTWKLIAGLMENAAVNHERSNGNDMGNRGNFELVSFGQRISESHLGAGDDANGGGRISEHLVGKCWQTHQNRKNKQRHGNRKTGEDSSALVAQQVLEDQEYELCHVFLCLLRWSQRDSGVGRDPALLRADKYPFVETINGVDEPLRAGVVRDHDDRLEKLPIELCKQAQDVFRRFGVQVARRFIRDQNRRVGDNGARDRDALLLPARKLPRIMFHAVCQTDRLKGGVDVSLSFGFAQMRQEQGQFDIFKCGQDGNQIVKLKHQANVPRAPRCQLAFVHRGNVFFADHNAA